MIDDEFYLDDDDLNSDCELDIADKEILAVTDAMEEILNKIRDNIKFGETSEFKKNMTILSTYVNSMVDLSTLSAQNNVSTAEKMEIINNIDASIRALEYTDLTIEDLPEDNTSGFDLLGNSGDDNFDF